MNKLLTLTVILITLNNIHFSTSQNSSIDHEQLINEIKTTFELLEEGQRNIILSQQRDVALIVGNTGSGKSTIIQWLFGDNDKLISVQSADKSFRIEDGNVKIGNSTIESKTLFPELVIDNSTDNAYYDCPGFKDTRQTSHDLAITYFIKRVADHAHKVKFVFVINHSSLRIGVDRQDFKDLLSHATDLIKDIDKFSDSICAMATKVENSVSEDDEGNLVLVSDEDIIKGIAEFLTEVRNEMKNDASKVEAVKLINIFLLRNNDGSYARIGIFRRPSRAGPLSKIPSLQKGKKHILNILNSLNFTSKNDQDFGYTVSDRSKGDISYIVQEIGVTVGDNLDKIGHVLLDKFHESVKNVNKKVNDFADEDNNDVDSDTINEEIERANNFLISGIGEVSRMVGEINALKSPSELAQIIRSALSNLKLDLGVNDKLNIISKQGEFFDFLQLVSKKTFSLPKSWALNLESKAQNISILNAEFQNSTNAIVEKIATQVDALFSSLGRTIYDHHGDIVENMKNRISLDLNGSNVNVLPVQVTAMKADVNTAIAAMAKLVANIKSAQDLTVLYKKVIQSVGKISIDKKLTLKLQKFLNFLNRKNDDKMRQSWSILFRNEVIKISALNDQFEQFVKLIIEDVKTRLHNHVTNTLGLVTDYYEKLSQNIKDEVGSFMNGTSKRTSDPFGVQKRVNELIKGHSTISGLSKESIYITSPSELSEKMTAVTSALNIDALKTIMPKIEHYLSFVTFLLEVKNNQAFTMPVNWIKMFQDEAATLLNFRDNCRSVVSAFINGVDNSLTGFIGQVNAGVLGYYDALIKNVTLKLELLVNGSEELRDVDASDALKLRDDLDVGISTISNLAHKVEALTNVTLLADQISLSLKDKPFEISAELIQSIENEGLELNYLLIASNETRRKSWAAYFHNTPEQLAQLRQDFRAKAINVTQKMEREIESLVTKFSESLTEHYDMKLNLARSELRQFTQETGLYREVNESRGRELAFDLEHGVIFINKINISIQSLSAPLELTEILNSAVTNISGLHLQDNLIEKVAFRAQVLNFVLLATNVEFRVPNSWSNLIKNTRDACAKSLREFKDTVLSPTVDTVYSLIKSDLEAVAKKMIQHYERKIADENFSVLLLTLKSGENAVTELSAAIKKEANLLSYLNNILACLTRLDIDRETMHKALKRYKFLEFMQPFSPENNLNSAEQFNNLETFKDVTQFVRESHIWYTFLLEVDEKLSPYEIQSDVSKYDVANLDDWGKVNKPRGISINKLNFLQLLDTIKISGAIRSVELTDARLQALNNVFVLNFKSKLENVCERGSDQIVLRGDYVKFSDFIDGNDAFQNPCGYTSKNIEILASKTVFIDRNLLAIGNEYRVSITSPRWEVIGSGRAINLSGKDAAPPAAARASDGQNPGSSGDHGVDGLAGGAAGSFFGTGQVFINGNQLSVSVNGGNGGRGQDGGHGKSGSDGQFVYFSEINDADKFDSDPTFAWDTDRLPKRAEYFGYSHWCDTGNDRCAIGFICFNECERDTGCWCKVWGRSGTSGGNGGNGGKAGAGAKEGTLEIVELGDKSSGISQSRHPGADGQGGKGGDGGSGGKSQFVSLNYKENGLGELKGSVELTLNGEIKESAANGAAGVSY